MSSSDNDDEEDDITGKLKPFNIATLANHISESDFKELKHVILFIFLNRIYKNHVLSSYFKKTFIYYCLQNRCDFTLMFLCFYVFMFSWFYVFMYLCINNFF